MHCGWTNGGVIRILCYILGRVCSPLAVDQSRDDVILRGAGWPPVHGGRAGGLGCTASATVITSPHLHMTMWLTDSSR